jgi:hypothetical protein
LGGEGGNFHSPFREVGTGFGGGFKVTNRSSM